MDPDGHSPGDERSPETPGTLTGRVALITGGGSGIGLACARALATDGATVVLTGRSPERLAAGAAELTDDGLPAGRVHTVECDVTDHDAVGEACAAAATHGPLAMLLVNAGFGSAAPLHRTSIDDWTSVLATNLTGAFSTIHHAIPHLAAAARTIDDGAAIVAVSSIAGVATHRYMTPYNVSKAGLEMLVRQAADELGGSGIRANAVRPGLVPTDASQMLVEVDEIREDYLAQMPLGRVGETGDVARLVRFLLGPESRWITGTCISVDGGHHLRRGPDLEGVMRMLHGDDLHP